MDRSYYIYILTNRWNTVLYTGMTSDLANRMDQHRARAVPSFSRRYNLTKLVHVEVFDESAPAADREKQIKRWTRAKKLALIETCNPGWRDLGAEW